MPDSSDVRNPGLQLGDYITATRWRETAGEAFVFFAETYPVQQAHGEVDPQTRARAFESWLMDPLGPRDVQKMVGSLYDFWNEQPFARQTLADVILRLLAIPATEAQCERIFGALRRAVYPHGCRMEDATVAARISALLDTPEAMEEIRVRGLAP